MRESILKIFFFNFKGYKYSVHKKPLFYHFIQLIPEHRPLKETAKYYNMGNNNHKNCWYCSLCYLIPVSILNAFRFGFLTTKISSKRPYPSNLLQPTSIKYFKLVTNSTRLANNTNSEILPIFTLCPWNRSLSLSWKISLLTCPSGHQQ